MSEAVEDDDTSHRTKPHDTRRMGSSGNSTDAKHHYTTASAFKPVESSRIQGGSEIDLGSYPPPPNCVTFVGFPAPPSSQIGETRSFAPLKSSVKSEEEVKGSNLHSPDSKQYTILQPAGEGDRDPDRMSHLALTSFPFS